VVACNSLVGRLFPVDQAREAQRFLGLPETALPLLQNLQTREFFIRAGGLP
jgi:hypothetical protein